VVFTARNVHLWYWKCHFVYILKELKVVVTVYLEIIYSIRSEAYVYLGRILVHRKELGSDVQKAHKSRARQGYLFGLLHLQHNVKLLGQYPHCTTWFQDSFQKKHLLQKKYTLTYQRCKVHWSNGCYLKILLMLLFSLVRIFQQHSVWSQHKYFGKLLHNYVFSLLSSIPVIKTVYE
jgi:hypothetical protein